MRKAVIVVATLALIGVVDYTIHTRERLLENGAVVLLALVPVDPRAMMQGDYMALRYRIGQQVAADAATRGGVTRLPASDGRVVVALDANAVASFRRVDDGAPLAADETRLRYRVRNGTVTFATNGYFFEEGHGRDYASARYGEFRVDRDGEMILTALRDGELRRLGSSR